MLGIRPKKNAERDAVHVAIAPVVADENLKPGDRVEINASGRAFKGPNPIGIVDPFLNYNIIKDDEFYLCLFPGTIVSLNHVWRHPAFNQDKETSIKWIEKFAEVIGQSYDDLMATVSRNHEYGDYTYDNTESYKDADWSEFPKHYKMVTGVDLEYDGCPYTCSC